MPDREKVIDALKRCSYDPDPGQLTKEFLSCNECPYQQGCTHDLMRDVLILLKEQDEEIKCLRARVRLNAEFGLQEPLEEVKDEEKH